MPVKIDPHIVAELAELDLVIWEAKHPKIASGVSPKTGRLVFKESKAWVVAVVTGPGVDGEKHGGGPTLSVAVDAILRTYFADRVPGLRGAILRAERALFDLAQVCSVKSFKLSGAPGASDYDDDIPF